MTVRSKAEFARLAGVARSSVAAALASGSLVENEDRQIDDGHPTNRDYLARRRTSAPASGRNGTGRPIEDGAAGADTAEGLRLRERRARATLAEIRQQRAEIDLAREKKKIILVQQVAHGMAVLRDALEVNFRLFSESHGDELFEIARARSSEEFRAVLSKRIDAAVESAVDSIGRALEAMTLPADAPDRIYVSVVRPDGVDRVDPHDRAACDALLAKLRRVKGVAT